MHSRFGLKYIVRIFVLKGRWCEEVKIFHHPKGALFIQEPRDISNYAAAAAAAMMAFWNFNASIHPECSEQWCSEQASLQKLRKFWMELSFEMSKPNFALCLNEIHSLLQAGSVSTAAVAWTSVAAADTRSPGRGIRGWTGAASSTAAVEATARSTFNNISSTTLTTTTIITTTTKIFRWVTISHK